MANKSQQGKSGVKHSRHSSKSMRSGTDNPKSKSRPCDFEKKEVHRDATGKVIQRVERVFDEIEENNIFLMVGGVILALILIRQFLQ